MIPTLLGILVINFFIVQIAPGGPIQQIISKVKGQGSDVDIRLGGQGDFILDNHMSNSSAYMEAQGVDPEFIKQLEIQFGFDQPIGKRFLKMLKDYLRFDLGKSYFKEKTVSELIFSKLPVSLSIGFWTTLIVYVVSIPLGIKKAIKNGSFFDTYTSLIVIVAYAIPSFLFALFLIIFFAGGSFFSIFPLRGLTSDSFESMTLFHKVLDYFWHIILPVTAMVMSGFAKLTLLTKNSFLDEIQKQYVTTARSKGLNEKKILYGHVFRNAMLIVIAGFPAAFIGILFTSSLLIEVLFSLDGLGLLGFEAAMNRDYPVMFGALFIFTLTGMVMHLLGDIAYMLVDRRIDLSDSRG